MKKHISAIILLFAFSMNILHAEQLASILRGKIIASNLSTIQVILKESDGSILDLTDLSATGEFDLDLTIMDMPSLAQVKKLIIEVKNKSGHSKHVYVSQYLNVFADTVILKPIYLK